MLRHSVLSWDMSPRHRHKSSALPEWDRRRGRAQGPRTSPRGPESRQSEWDRSSAASYTHYHSPCCLSHTRGCSEEGSGEDTRPWGSPQTSEEGRRPLPWSLSLLQGGRRSWTFSLIEFIRIKSLQSSPKVKLQLRVRVFEWGLRTLNHLKVEPD